ncbi:Type II secretion system protein H [Saliniradius amylolyticus]|uniref:Type II secretion system protein H n=1 Tax=Saliniradius amylolyticus TaxID=2183582 RepID=A0A2S2DYZ4_9ALTE|nr:type II secretion system minor pseudopilin GspH [Saliniradius amylolyticus]AWL10625.1 Type II secretion system protein H [Saliniradius amylolyticus]
MSLPTYPQRGFTLLEVMLVLLLMGLMVGTITLTGFGNSAQDRLQKQAQRLQVVLNMASDHAILNQQQLGLRVEPEKNRYFFMVLDEDQRWRRISTDSQVLREHQLPEEFAMELQLTDLPWQEDDSLFSQEVFDEELSVSDAETQIGNDQQKPLPPPQIWLLSSGDLTPFSLLLSYEPTFSSDSPVYFRLQGQAFPPVTLKGPMDTAAPL